MKSYKLDHFDIVFYIFTLSENRNLIGLIMQANKGYANVNVAGKVSPDYGDIIKASVIKSDLLRTMCDT